MIMVRGILTEVSEGDVKRVISAGRASETFTDRECFQHYGYSSRPLNGAEGIFLLQGNKIVSIAEDDRRHRVPIENGEVILYTDENTDTFGHRLHFKRNREIEIYCTTKDVDVEVDKTLDIGNDYIETITRDKTETISRNKLETITGNKIEAITGNKNETIALNKNVTVTQNIVITASGDITITGTNVSIHATGTSTIDLDGNATINQSGTLDVVSTGGDTTVTNATGKVKVACATAEIISGSVDLGALGGAAVSRVGDITSVSGGASHTHTIAAGSALVRAG